ncbi:Crp/Fnr family transcriptional regulator [Neorhizobium sp. T786]|uniref:Crp/Fnr family transcriptional regulator n=1 Tax=Pseudorhizobium xiangyangii TaxID=2883104 RepID=UPI001CFFFFEC|nr:Crp/Fnr family transcriptional regulator [Neorhizobium xiangyangii]MCB5203823.1 Crp/Fnr family transcriptional regulator [Neorhizobium xiangyangii]
MSHHSTTFHNQLLSQLPAEEARILAPHLEWVELPRDFLIVGPGQDIAHIYFLEEGIGSIVAVSPEGQKAEAGMFGPEGFAPIPPTVGSTKSFHEVCIQSAGYGHRLDIRLLAGLMHVCPELYQLLVKSSHNLATQVSYTALSNAIHQVNERLARWLLMCHDRIGQDELTITHDYIALMLGVRRPSVTTALHVLEGNRFLRNERGRVFMRDRIAMEEFAKDAYGIPEDEHRLLFKPVASSPSVTVLQRSG